MDRKIDLENFKNITEVEMNIFLEKNQIFSINVNPKFKIIFHMMINKIDLALVKNHIDENTDKHIIFIYSPLKTNMTSIKRIIEYCTSLNITLEIFKITELLYNVYHHTLVPTHEPIVDPKLIEEIKQKYLKEANQ